MLRQLRLVPLLLGLYAASPSGAQSLVLEAELPKALQADALAQGSTFAMKVSEPWKDGACTLSPGALLHASVQRAERTTKGRVRSITFEVKTPCSDEKPLSLVVTGLLAPTDVELLSQQQFRGSSFGGSSGTAGSGIKQGDTPDMSGRQNAALPFSSGPTDRSNRPQTVHLGEVYHLGRTQLTMPAPGGTESTISTSGATLSLPARTTFLLQGSRLERQMVAMEPVKLVRAAVRRPALIRPCLAGRCSQRSATEVAGSLYNAHLLTKEHELTPYGFRGEGDRELREWNDGAGVYFLGNDQVVATFPTHLLVKRLPGTPVNNHPRSLRAVLLRVPDGSLSSVRSWEVQDSKPYVWPLGDKLLIHDAGGLLLLGPELQQETAFPLSGPLAAVRVSPDHDRVLLGVERELHSVEEHNLLVQADARGPEEEVRWHALDGNLRADRLLGISSSYKMPAIVTNQGLIELRKESEEKYHLVGQSLDTGAETQLGSFDSSCVPNLATTQPNLLVLSTCDTKDVGAHSFLLQQDGTPVLDQALGWHDFPLGAVSASETHRVAFLVAHGKDEYIRGKAFRPSSMRSAFVEVVDAGTGVLVATVPLHVASPYRQAVAVSPDGHRLAVLDGSSVALYQLEP